MSSKACSSNRCRLCSFLRSAVHLPLLLLPKPGSMEDAGAPTGTDHLRLTRKHETWLIPGFASDAVAEHDHPNPNETRYWQHNQDFINGEYLGLCHLLCHMSRARTRPATRIRPRDR